MATALTEVNISAGLNQVLRAVMRLDELLIVRGWKLPFGGLIDPGG